MGRRVPVICFIPTCNSKVDSKLDSRHCHFKCPDDPERQSAWLARITGETNQPENIVKRSRICDRHFESRYIIKESEVLMNGFRVPSGVERRSWILTSDAIPTLFSEYDIAQQRKLEKQGLDEESQRLDKVFAQVAEVSREFMSLKNVDPLHPNQNSYGAIAGSTKHPPKKSDLYIKSRSCTRVKSVLYEENSEFGFKIPSVPLSSIQDKIFNSTQKAKLISHTQSRNCDNDGVILPEYDLKEICVLCNDILVYYSDTKICLKDEERRTFLRILYSEIFGIEDCYWFTQYSNFPFCSKCMEQVEEICETRRKFKIYEFLYEKLKEEFVKKFVRAFCVQRCETSNDPKWKEFCQSETVLGALCQKWRSNWMSRAETKKEPNPDKVVGKDYDVVYLEIQDDNNVEPQHEEPTGLNNHSTDANTLPVEMELETDSNVIPVEMEVEAYGDADDGVSNVQETVKNCNTSKTNGAENSTQGPYCDIENSDFESYFLPTDSSGKKKITTSKMKQRKPKVAKKKVQCPVCNIWTLFSNIGNHMRIHSGEKPYSCTICDKHFRRKGKLRTHQRNHDTNDKRIYYCNICLLPFNTKLKFLRHQHADHLNRDIQAGTIIWFFHCDLSSCMHSYSSHEELQRHLLSHFSENTGCYTCQTCFKIFAEEQNLWSHERVHSTSDSSWFDCSFCHLIFENEDFLLTHQDVHKIEVSANIFSHLCDVCGKSFRLKMNLKQHQRSHNESVDPNPYSDISNLKRSDLQNPNRNNSECTCTICGKTYSSKTNLRDHSFTHKPNHEGFYCHYCNKKFNNPTALRFHTRLHEGRGPTLSKCQYCNSSFHYAWKMRKHLVRIHPQIYLASKPHHCITCWNCFSTEAELVKHYDLNHANKKCRFCGKQFSTRRQIEFHEATHTGKKFYTCEQCGKAFTHDSNFREHLKRHTGDRPFICQICSEGFFRRQYLQAHINKVHSAEEQTHSQTTSKRRSRLLLQ